MAYRTGTLFVSLGKLRAFVRALARSRRRLTVVSVLGLAALGFGVTQLFPRHTAPPQAVKAAVVTYSTNKPSEDKPGDGYPWHGTPAEPKKLTMPTIGVSGFVQQVGVDQHKQIAVPNNVHVAGWFVDTVKPGEKGLSIIDGHVSGVENPGVFKNLAALHAGDTYEIEFGDGLRKNFKVRGVTTVPTADAQNVLFSQDPTITHQVNLVTCGGAYSSSAHAYDKRVVVVSELVAK